MPEQQRSGNSSGPKIWLSASVTQSVGVPSTVQWRSSMRRMRSGRESVRLCEAPLISEAGATTYTSPNSRRASSNFVRPSECMPSSFVRRMRTIRLNRQTLHLNVLIYSSELSEAVARPCGGRTAHKGRRDDEGHAAFHHPSSRFADALPHGRASACASLGVRRLGALAREALDLDGRVLLHVRAELL